MKSVDYKLFFSVLLLIIFWMIMISSVSVYSSYRVTDLMVKAWLIAYPYNYFYVIRNIWHVTISLILLGVISKIPYRYFEKYIKPIAGVIVFMLFYVLVKWMTIKWASWWINISWLPFTIQPTEFLKFGLILFLSAYLKANKHKMYDFKKWFLPFAWIIWFVTVIVWLQPDFWTLMILLPVSAIIYFISWSNIKYLTIVWALWALLIVSVYSYWSYDKKTWESLNKLWYITKRIDNFLSDNKTAIANKSINYQTEQWLIAIWSWWFGWLWFGQSIQKFGYLPEVQGDFIFSVIVEELGFVWALILVSFYIYITYRWFYIASRVDDLFAKYSVIWISSWILIQAFINIWVNLNIVPLTWVTLPFISYWGSSLLSLAIAVWFMLNVSRYMTDTKLKYHRLWKYKLFKF